MTIERIRLAKFCIVSLLLCHVANAFLSPSGRTRRNDVSRTSLQAQLHDRMNVKLLLVDHYDSFTYNLADLLARYCAQPPDVMHADDPQLLSSLDTYDGVVLSPGPGHPRDYPASLQLVQQFDRPILGVCMGHQLLALVYAGASSIIRAPTPIHGQIHALNITSLSDDPLWNSIELEPPVATRYHSLAVDLTTNVQTSLIPTATTREHPCVLMGLRHDVLPHFGVQFHPESIGSEALGRQLVENFCKHVASTKATTFGDTGRQNFIGLSSVSSLIVEHGRRISSPYTVYIRKVPHLPPNGANYNPAQLFDSCLSCEDYSFWLDRESSECEGISILGSGRRRVQYQIGRNGREVEVVDGQTSKVYKDKDILSYLEEVPSVHTIQMLSGDAMESSKQLDAMRNGLPFDFCGGFVGYLGYEVRHDTAPKPPTATENSADHPSAAFIWADKSFVFDHEKSEWYLVGVAAKDNTEEIMEWIKSRTQHLQQGIRRKTVASRSQRRAVSLHAFRPNRPRETYARNFADCMEYIRRGDSYELCLTNQIEASAPCQLSPLQLFHVLRRRNPAPHAAYFQWGTTLAICCSSPERFLSLAHEHSQRVVESKPIKGTARRVLDDPVADAAAAEGLRTSIKDRAENHMIVDLLRNDLHRVCTTVDVPSLMAIESFATVHQMVSTIRGILRPDCTAVDVLRACFPGGSMTGAPKLRSMEILDELEEQVPRGVYSGCLGYLSGNGSMDMNIVIRSAVLTKDELEADSWKVRIGAGGAITALSDGEDEYDEMWLKASAVMKAVEEWAEQGLITESHPRRETGQKVLNATVPAQ